jgi:type IV secretory pathway ATPase VirB11/archaellum biosynthesis ATPase
MDIVTSPPIEDFLVDADTGRAVVVALRRALDGGAKILVWGPRVGAIEIVEDLFELWPASGPLVAVNAGARCTRTRQQHQDSGWVEWAEVDALGLMREALHRQPHGLVLTLASDETAPMLGEAMSQAHRGFVTSVPASSAEAALESFMALGPGRRPDYLLEVRELDGQYVVGDVHHYGASGARSAIFQLEPNKRYSAHPAS